MSTDTRKPDDSQTLAEWWKEDAARLDAMDKVVLQHGLNDEDDPDDDTEEIESDDDDDGEVIKKMSTDSSGHEHKGKGEGGGQFTGDGDGSDKPSVASIIEALDKNELTVPKAKRIARLHGYRKDSERGELYEAMQRSEARQPKRELSESQKSAIIKARAESDREQAIENMQVRQLVAAEDELEKAGAKRTHDSESGSSYWELPNGQSLRLSDHALPSNNARDARLNDPWENEIIFRGRGDEQRAIDQIRELLKPQAENE